MNASDGIPFGAILEDIEQGGVENTIVIVDIQDQVERSGPGLVTTSLPVLRGAPPVAPKFWGRQSDLVPVVANEEEVVRSLFQPTEVALEGDVTTKDIAEHFWRELGNVQQRVPSAF